MKVKFLDLPKQNKKLKEELMAEFGKIIDSAAFVAGEITEKFEREFAEYCGVKHCVATNNGTSALHAALSCYDMKGEVVTAPNSFIATSEAISYCPKLKHRFVDVDYTGNVKFENVINSVSQNTKMMLPVSLYGNPCDLVQLTALSKSKKKVLIHDAAQAHGAEVMGCKISEFADITCFSFYPGKNLGACGEGGALVTDSSAAYSIAKCLINHGQPEKYKHDLVGYNYRMSQLQAASLSVKLKHLDTWTNKRIKAAERYRSNLKGRKKIRLLDVSEKNKCVYHLFPIFVRNRDAIIEKLNKANIQTGIHYPIPIHLQHAYKHLNHKAGSFPVAEEQALNEISLPIYPELTNNKIDYVSEVLLKSV